MALISLSCSRDKVKTEKVQMEYGGRWDEGVKLVKSQQVKGSPENSDKFFGVVLLTTNLIKLEYCGIW